MTEVSRYYPEDLLPPSRSQPSREALEELSALRKKVLRICQQAGRPMTLASITYGLVRRPSTASITRTVNWLWWHNWLQMSPNSRAGATRLTEDVYYLSEEVNQLVS